MSPCVSWQPTEEWLSRTDSNTQCPFVSFCVAWHAFFPISSFLVSKYSLLTDHVESIESVPFGHAAQEHFTFATLGDCQPCIAGKSAAVLLWTFVRPWEGGYYSSSADWRGGWHRPCAALSLFWRAVLRHLTQAWSQENNLFGRWVQNLKKLFDGELRTSWQLQTTLLGEFQKWSTLPDTIFDHVFICYIMVRDNFHASSKLEALVPSHSLCLLS